MAKVGSAKDGDVLIMIGVDGSHLGSSVYLRDVLDTIDGPAPIVDLVAERRNGEFVRAVIRNAQVTACHDISSGGLGVALAEMAMASGKGLTVSLADQQGPAHALLFGEDQARYVIAVPADLANFVQASAESAGVPFRTLGKIGGERVVVEGVIDVAVTDLKTAHESWFPAFMA
jgi:phosphoribosylformylglycinamidine synthase subunit PurL